MEVVADHVERKNAETGAREEQVSHGQRRVCCRPHVDTDLLLVTALGAESEGRPHVQTGMSHPRRVAQTFGLVDVAVRRHGGVVGDDDLGLGSQATHDVARLGHRAESQGHVETFLDEVMDIVVEQEIDLQRRIQARERYDNRCNERRQTRIEGKSHTQGSRWRGLVSFDDLLERPNGGEHLVCRIENQRSDLREM